jgi:hypothetical protein
MRGSLVNSHQANFFTRCKNRLYDRDFFFLFSLCSFQDCLSLKPSVQQAAAMLFCSKSFILFSNIALICLAALAATAAPARSPYFKRDDIQMFKDSIICDAMCYAGQLRSMLPGDQGEREARRLLECAGKVTSKWNVKEDIRANFGLCVDASTSTVLEVNRSTLQQQQQVCAAGCHLEGATR